MRISVVIPVYNSANYIVKAIDSVLSQPEVTELILVEDGSADNSLELCRQQARLDNRIVVLQHEDNKNKGVSATRNLGIKNATESYIAFLDADDYYLPGRFKQTKECFASDDNIDGVYEMIGIHSDSNGVRNYSNIEIVQPAELFESLEPLGYKLWFSGDGLTVKKSVFDKAGFFDESLKTSEDTLQWFKLAATSNLVAGEIRHPIAMTQKNASGLSSDRIQVQKDFILMLLKLFKWCTVTQTKKSRKELVLNKYFFYTDIASVSVSPVERNKFRNIMQVILTDPWYVLTQSKAFRLYVGDRVGYIKAIDYLNRKLNNKR